jgi:hypothetical protein
METDMSPIDDSVYYEPVNPRMEPPQHHQQPVYYEPPPPPPPQPVYYDPPPQQQPRPEFPQKMHQFDLFSYIDKTTWIIILVIFIIGFFMGKTTQPVYIKTV